jgi:hypothetical protein
VLGEIDSVVEFGGPDAREGIVADGGVAVVKGWAVDAATHRPVDALTVAIGGGIAVRAILGFARDDIAQSVADDAARGSGFVAAVPIDAPAGSQPILLDALVGEEWVAMENEYEVTVAPPSDPFGGLRPRRQQWLFGLEGIYVGEAAQAAREGEDWILERGAMGHIRLWALDTAAGEPVGTVLVRAGGTYFTAVRGFATPDVAAATALRGAQNCGFTIPVMAPLVGAESIQIFAIAADGQAYGELCTVRLRLPAPLGLDAVPNDGAALGAFDGIAVNGTVVDHMAPIHAPRGAIVSLQGWALDRRGPRLAALVELDVPGGGTFEAKYGLRRADVAQELNCAATDCGFSLSVDSERLEPGTYRTSLRVLGARRDGFTELPHVDLVVH